MADFPVALDPYKTRFLQGPPLGCTEDSISLCSKKSAKDVVFREKKDTIHLKEW